MDRALRNAAQPALLRLPPEIRNRIYEYALGGSSIYICQRVEHHGREKVFLTYNVICQNEIPDEDLALSLRHLTEPVDVESDTRRHERCHLSNLTVRRHLQLHLLQVCSQIHREVALVPFESNCFLTTDYSALTKCAKKLIPAQARAIKRLVVSDDGENGWKQNLMYTVPQLSHVTLFHEVSQWWAAHLDVITREEWVKYFVGPEYPRNINRVYPVASATVCFHHASGRDGSAPVSPHTDPVVFRPMSELAEDLLKGSSKKVADPSV